MITLLTHSPCDPCGFIRTGLMVSVVRINKRSMRTQGTNIIMLPERCRECGRTSAWPDTVTWQPDPDDAAKIDAYRLRRWPELAAERSLAGAG